MRPMFLYVVGLALTGCASRQTDVPELIPSPTALPEVQQPEAAIRPRARPDSAVPAASPTSASASGALGVTVASLGNPAEPGLWLKTPLVSVRQTGTVMLGGASVQVALIPLEGPKTAGSRMSLEAFQALGASLTDLPEVSVSAG